MGAGYCAGLVETLVDLNRDVMWKRDKASPWVQVANGKPDVPFADERAKQPTAEQLAAHWVSPYFLGAALLIRTDKWSAEAPSRQHRGCRRYRDVVPRARRRGPKR